MATHIVRAIREGEEMFMLTESPLLSEFEKNYGQGDFNCLQHIEVHKVSLTEPQEKILRALELIQQATDCPQPIEDMLVAIFRAGYHAGRR